MCRLTETRAGAQVCGVSAPALHQQDLEFNIEKPDWVALNLVLRKIEEDLADNRRHLLRKVVNWFMGLEMFREFEVNREDAGPIQGRDLEYYRAALTTLLAQGEHLAVALRSHSEVDPSSIGMDPHDVAANVSYLRNKYAMRFFELGQERRQAILREVFGESV